MTSTSAAVLRVWRDHGAEIVEARRHPRHTYGRHGVARRYGITVRQARRLLTLLREHGPTPPADVTPYAPPTGKVTIEVHDTHATAAGSVRTLDDLLTAADVDPDAWRVASWQARAWDSATGGGATRTMYYVRAALERRRGGLLSPVTHAGVPTGGYPTRATTGPTERVLLIPDAQIGHRRIRRDGREVLVPMHDRSAMSCAWQVATMAQPDSVVLLGDMLDLTEMSTRYPRPLDVLGTAQAAIVELAWWLRDLRERVGPSCRIQYIEGNHEYRLHRLTVERAASLDVLQAVTDDRPALSVPRLLGLDALGIEYVGPYGEDTWLWPDSAAPVRIHHGQIVRPRGGATVAAQLARGTSSVVGGHVHRVEVAWRTTHGPTGRRARIAVSPGCLCRVDGAVPGSARPDWQQGWGWLTRDVERDQVYGAAVPIIDGRTVYRAELVDAAPADEVIAMVRRGTGLDDIVRP